MNVTWMGYVYRLETEADVISFCRYFGVIPADWWGTVEG